MPSIVQISVSETSAPAPLTFQQQGALISQGATTLAAGTTSLLVQTSSLTALLAAPVTLSSLAWSAGTVLATTVAAISGLNSGDQFHTTIAGATPSGYNGTFLATVTGANTFIYVLAPNPGTETAPGTYTPFNQVGLSSAVSTFFDQGTSNSVAVLELGPGDGSTGPAALQAWITANPGVFYSYLVPGLWDGTAGMLALANAFTALNAKTYFFITTSSANGTAGIYTGLKSVVCEVPAPTVSPPEFSLAAAYQHSLAYNPSSSNRMTPFAFSYLYGVTPYPTVGNSAVLTGFKTNNVNYVGTGAEGGISNTILLWGPTSDGVDFMWWYSVDWAQLSCDQAVAAAVIQGSNNPLNPLYYNQTGVNTLQDVAVGVVSNAISFGLANGTVVATQLTATALAQNISNGVYAGQCVVNAVPFIPYIAQNPSNYQAGIYGGLSCLYIPQVGFRQILFQIQVTGLIGTQ